MDSVYDHDAAAAERADDREAASGRSDYVPKPPTKTAKAAPMRAPNPPESQQPYMPKKRFKPTEQERNLGLVGIARIRQQLDKNAPKRKHHNDSNNDRT